MVRKRFSILEIGGQNIQSSDDKKTKKMYFMTGMKRDISAVM